DGGELKPERVEPVLRALARVKRLAARGDDDEKTAEKIGAILRDLPIRPALIDEIVASLNDIANEFDEIKKMPAGPERNARRRALVARVGMPERAFRARYAVVR